MKFVIEESKMIPGRWTITAILNGETCGWWHTETFSEAMVICDKARQELIGKLTETK